MTALRGRIEARRAALLSERAIAEAALSRFHLRDSWNAEYDSVGDHIAAQDPATTIARIDRELAGIDADLALLDFMESDEADYSALWDAALDGLNARYPEGGSA